MHPGNILVRVGQSSSSNKRFFRSRPHVIFIDVGMTAELSNNDRLNLLEFFKAVALRDGRTAAECTLKFSRNQSCPDPDSFIKVYLAYYGDSFVSYYSQMNLSGKPVWLIRLL